MVPSPDTPNPASRRILLRFLLFQAFLLWQGGFLFYALVVVPIGTDLLGSATEQGMITRHVTNWLNLFGVAWVVLFLIDLLVTADPSPRRRRVRWVGWAISIVGLVFLAWLHPVMAGMLDQEEGYSARSFGFLHGVYLWVSAAHWVAGLVLAWTTLRAWQAVDGLRPLPPTMDPACSLSKES